MLAVSKSAWHVPPPSPHEPSRHHRCRHFCSLDIGLVKKKSFPRQQLFLYIASSIHQQIKRALRSSSKDVTENFSLLKRRVYSLSPHYFTNNLMQGSFQKNLWPPTFFRSFLPHTQKKLHGPV